MKKTAICLVLVLTVLMSANARASKEKRAEAKESSIVYIHYNLLGRVPESSQREIAKMYKYAFADMGLYDVNGTAFIWKEDGKIAYDAFYKNTDGDLIWEKGYWNYMTGRPIEGCEIKKIDSLEFVTNTAPRKGFRKF